MQIKTRWCDVRCNTAISFNNAVRRSHVHPGGGNVREEVSSGEMSVFLFWTLGWAVPIVPHWYLSIPACRTELTPQRTVRPGVRCYPRRRTVLRCYDISMSTSLSQPLQQLHACSTVTQFTSAGSIRMSKIIVNWLLRRLLRLFAHAYVH